MSVRACMVGDKSFRTGVDLIKAVISSMISTKEKEVTEIGRRRRWRQAEKKVV